jgi:predicted anti-sigma-YlaC factor YlaD
MAAVEMRQLPVTCRAPQQRAREMHACADIREIRILADMRSRVSSRVFLLAIVSPFTILSFSCSINQFAVRTVAGFLAGSGQGTVFTGEDDPELVGEALPFALKIYESLLEADPANASLALATGRAYVSYAFAFVQAPADVLPAQRVDEQRAMRQRAKKLFLRARGYVLRGLETRHPGFTASLDGQGAQAALRMVNKSDADYLYWAGAAWLAAFSADPFDFAQIVTVTRAVALLQQVQDWDDAYDAGAVHEILVSYYGSAPADLGGSEQKARQNFQRAVSLSKGLRVGPYIALASSVSVKNQDAGEFRDLLGKALGVNVDADIPDRLVNIINQRRARWMLDHIDDFFLDNGGGQ